MYSMILQFSFPGAKALAPISKDGTKYLISTSKDKAIKRWYKDGVYYVSVNFTDKSVKRAYSLINSTILNVMKFLSSMEDKKSRVAIDDLAGFMRDYFGIMGSQSIANGFRELVNSEYSYQENAIAVYITEVGEDE